MSAMRDTLVIAKRELRERVKSKWFVAMTLLAPVFMVAMVVIPAIIAGRGADGTRVEIIDHTRVVGTKLATVLEANGWQPSVVDAATPEPALMQRIREDRINGFLVIPADALGTGTIIYRGDNASSQAVSAQLRVALTAIVQRERGARESIEPVKLDAVLADVEFMSKHTTGDTEGSSGAGAFFIAYILAIVLYMVITVYGVAVMRSVVVEKTSRVMELLVAAVKPSALMGGKILGVGAAGLIQIAVWLGMGAAVLAYRTAILGAFGVEGGGSALPPLAAAEMTIVLVYFVLGFFFYAGLYAAVGAMVSSDEESQQVQLPITMILVIGFVSLQVISNDPRGTPAAVMTMIPFWSPIVMPMRYVLGGASGLEVLASLGILVGSTAFVIRAAAKIYRVGVLMYGKRPTATELWRWLRH